MGPHEANVVLEIWCCAKSHQHQALWVKLFNSQ